MTQPQKFKNLFSQTIPLPILDNINNSTNNLSDKNKNGGNNQAPNWNFSKYLINEKGELMGVCGPKTSPLSDEILRLRKNLNSILSKNTKQTLKKIEKDTDRNFFMSSHEAKGYGIIDTILDKRK